MIKGFCLYLKKSTKPYSKKIIALSKNLLVSLFVYNNKRQNDLTKIVWQLT